MDEIKFKFDLDATGPLEEIEKLQSAINSLVKGEKLLELAEQIGGLLGPIGLVAAAMYALKKAFDLAQEGEKILRIENQFKQLATSVGLSSSKLKDGIAHATHGLTDMTEALEMANRAIITMGPNAERIPELMMAARKASYLMGISFEEAFEKLTMGVTTGSPRMLRQLGIILDTEKAVRNYALAHGVAVDQLTQFQKQQAITEATLAQADQKYGSVAIQTNTMAAAIRRLTIELKENHEAMAKSFATLAPIFAFVIDSFTKMIHLAKEAFSFMEEHTSMLSNKFQILLGPLGAIGDALSFIRKAYEKLGGAARQHAAEEKERLEKQEQERKAAHDKEIARQIELAEQQRIAKERQLKLDLEINAHAQKMIQDRMQYQTDEAAFRYDKAAQVQRMEEEFLIRKAQLEFDYREKGKINQTEYQEKSLALEEEAQVRRRQMIQRQKEEEIQFYENRVKYATTSAEGMSAAFAHGAAVAQKDLKDFGKQGQVVFQAVNKGAAGFFKGLGEGSKDASELMKEFMFGALADIAENQGAMLLASGIGTFNPVQIAEGGVLMALAGALRAQAGGKAGGGVSAGGGGGGGVTGAPSGVDIGISREPEETKKKTVNINFEGSYLETEQTQRRLLDLIRQETDATDYTYRQVGVR